MAANQVAARLKAAAALAAGVKSAALATMHGGMPHASLVTQGWDADGAPVLLLSALAAHTRHLRASPACALLLTGQAVDENPQTAPRLTLSGTAAQIEATGALRARYLQAHPYAAAYAGFADFAFWRVAVAAAQYIGGFGNACVLDVAALQHEICAVLHDG